MRYLCPHLLFRGEGKNAIMLEFIQVVSLFQNDSSFVHDDKRWRRLSIVTRKLPNKKPR